MLSRIFAALAALSIILPLAGPASAALTPDQESLVTEAKESLEAIKTLRARFVQRSENGTFATGSIFVRRPWQVRFAYDEPSPVMIVSSGQNLVYYDRDLDSVTTIPQERTPAWFLLSPTVELDGRVEVVDVQRVNDVTAITAIKTAEPEEGSVTLRFKGGDDMAFYQWEVTDATGERTLVTLDDIVLNKPILDEYFQAEVPRGSVQSP